MTNPSYKNANLDQWIRSSTTSSNPTTDHLADFNKLSLNDKVSFQKIPNKENCKIVFNFHVDWIFPKMIKKFLKKSLICKTSRKVRGHLIVSNFRTGRFGL